MAFRAVKSSTYTAIQGRAAFLKSLAASSRTAMAAGNVGANSIKQLLELFVSGKAELQAAAAVSGMAAYAQAQEGDGAYNVAAEFTAMIAACTSVIDWIVTNFPAASGYVQSETWSASGVSVRQFSPAQTAGLRTALQSFENTIN